MNTFNVRKANNSDIDFLIKSIIEADKSSTDVSSYSRLLGMKEDELQDLFKDIFDEELESCELAVDSFAVACYEDKAVAACASWIEGLDGLASWQLRTTALFCSLAPENLELLKGHIQNFSSINIPRTEGTLQIESVYIEPEYRGNGLFLELLNFHINFAKDQGHNFNLAELLTYNSNSRAEAAYRKVGFEKIKSSHSEHPNILDYYPSEGMSLWQKLI